MGGIIVTSYAPVYFVRFWPAYKSTYAFLNAISLTTLGLTSAILGGMISDKYEKKDYLIKSKILMFGNFMALPLIGLACWTTNFYVAMAAFAAMIFCNGSYLAPAITMMQNVVDPS